MTNLTLQILSPQLETIVFKPHKFLNNNRVCINNSKGRVYARGVRRTTSSSIDISIGKSVSDRVKL